MNVRWSLASYDGYELPYTNRATQKEMEAEPMLQLNDVYFFWGNRGRIYLDVVWHR